MKPKKPLTKTNNLWKNDFCLRQRGVTVNQPQACLIQGVALLQNCNGRPCGLNRWCVCVYKKPKKTQNCCDSELTVILWILRKKTKNKQQYYGTNIYGECIITKTQLSVRLNFRAASPRRPAGRARCCWRRRSRKGPALCGCRWSSAAR